MRKIPALALLCFFFPSLLSAQQAVLWVPAGAAGADEVIAALELDGGPNLTAALPPLSKELEERVKKLESAGRLELALRPAGDPPLPLLYYPSSARVAWAGKASTTSFRTDQYFLALRLTLARDAALRTYKINAAGLVSPPGGLVADYFPLARALGIKWVATGPLASTAAPVLEAGGVYAVPFVSFAAASYSPGPSFTIFDETSAADPAAVRAGLLAELKASSPLRKLTVSEALRAAVSTAAAPAEIEAAVSPWSADYTPWASAPVQTGALAALAQTRADLMLHLNAMQGAYEKASTAFGEYFSAEDGEKLRTLASPDPETAGEAETELRNSLGNAYRLMQRTPPPWVFSSLADATAATAQAGKISVSLLPGGFEMKNVAAPPQAPAKTPGLPAAADPERVWKLDGLRVEAGANGIVFQFTPLELDNSLRKPSGFSHVRVNLYIDVNHRPRAGLVRPLEGRPLRFLPDSAWEYAIEATPAGATLYKATPKGPAHAGSLKAAAENGRIVIRVPAALLKGNPARWSYTALLLAPKDGGGFIITDYIAEAIANGYIESIRPRRN